MIVIVGCMMVIGAVLAGFLWEGGHMGALVQPAELIVIGGAALGAMVIMSSKKVIFDLLRGIVQCVKGTPYNKHAYEDLLKALYDLFRLARRDGLIALESHLSEPEQSPLWNKYPRFSHNHHALEFACGALGPVMEGTVKPDQLPEMLEADMKMIEEEHHEPLGVLAKTADAMPGFGIVAAVLGIVITMGAIDGPPEEVGEKVGAALVGTFLGILISYGFLSPLAVKLESLGAAELAYFRTIATAILGFANELTPKAVLEKARRGVTSEFRPSRQELDDWLKQVDAG
ncbi:MAG: flagellar motor stator protein MotA [Thermoguttaceae bacterium]|jgi:chemotaxis protein MotA